MVSRRFAFQGKYFTSLYCHFLLEPALFSIPAANPSGVALPYTNMKKPRVANHPADQETTAGISICRWYKDNKPV
jgi:hypothetical protein